ncbi:hypothetical protein HCH17_05620 [Klebsiella aerogenes]|uniref:hypothetical protein n=1 Tax=Klebsiella aerogenes TaxID=548 RepID=UPI001C8B7E9B|nr:hypothetical protein [Klebsiella aerogenes]MBX8998177.1 hypothetical protein [Klebsiella aerogenes]HBU8522246.1 hypothetical protein [Klebsiella aerogenes]
MKFTTCCIPLLILTHSALAETRNLTLDWHFAKDGDKTEYLLDWPLITSKNGTAFTIRDTNGNLHLQATLKDPHKKELFTTDNVIGKYRYYYPSGKLKKTGQWNDSGRTIGLETNYYLNGQPKDVKRYLADGTYISKKGFYENGQVSYEWSDFDGIAYKEYRHYSSDGKLTERKYNKTQNSVIKEVIENYDNQQKLKSRTEKYGVNPHFEITYNSLGKPTKKITYYPSTGIKKEESFDEQGQLTDLAQRNVDNGYHEEGQQIRTLNGETTWSHYKNGVLEGAYKTIKNGKVISSRTFQKGKPVGTDLRHNETTGNIDFVEYDNNGKYVTSYYVTPDYIRYDRDGMPQIHFPFDYSERKLPPVDTIWEYTLNGKTSNRLRLIAVKNDIATYRFENSVIKESIRDYTFFKADHKTPSRRIFSFPLTPGKSWRENIKSVVKAPVGNKEQWQYTYTAETYSLVAGVAKITVAAGTFDTLVIEKTSHWTKSNPEWISPSTSKMRCVTSDCEISGATKEIFWYAPAAARVILKSAQTGSKASYLLGDSDYLLTSGQKTVMTELIGFGMLPENSIPPEKARYAHPLPPYALSLGFPLLPNDSWEYMMINNLNFE